MDELDSDRRRFLTWFAAGATLLSNPLGAALTRNGRTVRFPVAGVRFQGPLPRLSTGDVVEVVRERFQGENCYAVYAGSKRLGYVPRTLVPGLGDLPLLSGRLVAADELRLPWKRYEVALALPGPRA